jgi:putative transposase
MDIFRDDDDRRLFLSLLGEEVIRSRWLLHDYALMDNHYHLSLTTPECTLSTGMHRLLSRYVQTFNRRHGRRGHLFQDRFKSVLVDEEFYGIEVSRYIALNPVKANLCQRPEDWRWSSFRARIGLEPAPNWLAIEPLASLFGADASRQRATYREFVNAKVATPGDLFDHVIGQIYLGTTVFIDRVQALLDQHERSQDLPRVQVHPGRPDLDHVLQAVAQSFDTTSEAISTGHGSLERRMVAYLAFEEGLIPLRRIGRALHLRSAGAVSNLVRKCRMELSGSNELRELTAAILDRMQRRPPPPFFPPERPIPTARNYHRAQSRSRRT